MLPRLFLQSHKTILPYARPAVPAYFSTSSSAISAQPSEKFYLRHQEESKHVSGSKWKIYRVASVGLLGGLTACFLCPGNPIVDYTTVALLVHHNYAGLNSVFADYMPLFFPDAITKATMQLWLLISIITLALLFSFNYNNVGFSKALVAFFKL